MLVSIDKFPIVSKYAYDFITSVPQDYSYQWMEYNAFKKYAKDKLGVLASKLGVKKVLDYLSEAGEEIPTGGVFIVTSKTDPKDVTYVPVSNPTAGAYHFIFDKYLQQFNNYVELRKAGHYFA